jgi:hypothetical protein
VAQVGLGGKRLVAISAVHAPMRRRAHAIRPRRD